MNTGPLVTSTAQPSPGAVGPGSIFHPEHGHVERASLPTESEERPRGKQKRETWQPQERGGAGGLASALEGSYCTALPPRPASCPAAVLSVAHFCFSQ